MEAVFVECIEDVRKEILKRRLKNEVTARKKQQSPRGTADEELASREFEESLMRLASFAKGRIKYEDFTGKDKFNILDLFVNNEKTLIKIYEALFPHRAVVKGLNLPTQSTANSDRAIGRYGYHSGVAQPNISLQDSPPPSKSPLGSGLSSGKGIAFQYGSSLYGKNRPLGLGGSSEATTAFAGGSSQGIANSRVEEEQASRINQDSGFILPSIR